MTGVAWTASIKTIEAPVLATIIDSSPFFGTEQNDDLK